MKLLCILSVLLLCTACVDDRRGGKKEPTPLAVGDSVVLKGRTGGDRVLMTVIKIEGCIATCISIKEQQATWGAQGVEAKQSEFKLPIAALQRDSYYEPTINVPENCK